jgi:hypothetical protein
MWGAMQVLYACLRAFAPVPFAYHPLTERFATTLDECVGIVDKLRAQTAGVSIDGKHSDRDLADLLADLDQAAGDLEQGRANETLKDLKHYEKKLSGLVHKRLDLATAESLLSIADDAIDCAQHLTAPTPR